jgi:hypothetical protein
MIRQKTSSILNMDLTRLMGWLTHESKEKKSIMADSSWIKLPWDKSMKDDQTQAA